LEKAQEPVREEKGRGKKHMNKVIKYTIAGAFAIGLTLNSYAVITVQWGSGMPFPSMISLE